MIWHLGFYNEADIGWHNIEQWITGTDDTTQGMYF